MSGDYRRQALQQNRILMLSLLAGVGAYWCGGWPALLLLVTTRLLHATARASSRELLLFAIPGFWLVLQHLSQDRRLFFSWSMGLAACAMFAGNSRSVLCRAGSAGIITVLFLSIRIQQQATQRVLLIETLAAVGILGVAAFLGKNRNGRLFSTASSVAAASILACFSLAI